MRIKRVFSCFASFSGFRHGGATNPPQGQRVISHWSDPQNSVQELCQSSDRPRIRRDPCEGDGTPTKLLVCCVKPTAIWPKRSLPKMSAENSESLRTPTYRWRRRHQPKELDAERRSREWELKAEHHKTLVVELLLD